MSAIERVGVAVLKGWGFHGVSAVPATNFGTSYAIGYTKPGVPDWKRVRIHGDFSGVGGWERALLDAAGVPHYDKGER